MSAISSQYIERLLHAIHDRCGICGHCGKRKCVGRASHSILPEKLKRDEVLAAIEEARKREPLP